MERTQSLIEATVGKKVSLEVRLARSLPSIEADANQLQQVILNLVSNAAEAIGDESGVIRIRTGVDASHMVYLEVRDTGCGMDSETRSRIFDPFFTTKFTGRGLGAGGRGRNRARAPGDSERDQQSRPGQHVPYLIPGGGRVVAEPLSRRSGRSRRQRTVLVVDDEDVVQRIARATLEMRGYRVLLASDGLEAIRAIRENPAVARGAAGSDHAGDGRRRSGGRDSVDQPGASGDRVYRLQPSGSRGAFRQQGNRRVPAQALHVPPTRRKSEDGTNRERDDPVDVQRL